MRRSGQLAVAIAAASVAVGCLGAGDGFASGSARSQARTLPGNLVFPYVGAVVARHETKRGTVIVDKPTGGNGFYLAGLQARECLDYLRANPSPSASDFRAACPGVAVAKKRLAAR
jgi:hypothetical protein